MNLKNASGNSQVVARQNGMKALSIAGVPDDIHILISISTSVSVAKAVMLKGGSSKWIHDNFPKQRSLAWQPGYAAFSVNRLIQENNAFIKNRKEHHRKRTFQEEYISFLKKHRMDYDERYLWE